MEIYKRACQQAPGPDGVRRTRWAIVRNTYPDLLQSTVKTWLGWFPEASFGRFIQSKPMVHTLRRGDVHAEVVFIALDNADDISKLRSTEWTGIWFNEVEYIPKEVFDEAESRAGYYPAIKDGGPTWSGVIADLNAPSSDHWLPLMTGELAFPEDMPEHERVAYRWPDGWDYFVQPPGLIEKFGADGKTVVGYELNPAAENIQWIPRINGEILYLQTIKGKSKRWIDSRIMNRIVPPVLGTPVWPGFIPEVHVARVPLVYVPGRTLFVGLDFGRKPAAVFGQIINDRWCVLSELLGRDVGATSFAPMVNRHLEQNYPGAEVQLYGDPKGQDKTQSDDTTAYDIFRANGLNVRPAPVPTNAIKTRIEVIERILNEMRDGMPRWMVNPGCRVLVGGMSGGYHFSENADSNGEFKPDKKKGRYSDICDAAQYMVLGAGEGRALTGRVRGGALDVQPVKALRTARGSGRRRVA